MPVPRAVLEDSVGIVSRPVMDGEGLAQQLLCQGPLDLHSDNALRVGVQAGDVHLRPLGFRPELGDQLIVPGLIAGDVDVDILTVKVQPDSTPGQRRQQNDHQERPANGGRVPAKQGAALLDWFGYNLRPHRPLCR